MQQLQLIANPYINVHERELIGLIFNQSPENPFDFLQLIEKYSFFSHIKLQIIANIPFLEKPKQLSHNAFFNVGWVKDWLKQDYERKISSAVFRYQLITRARIAQKKIILPEGDEPRTIRAANICAEQNIAQCILVGNPQSITGVATKLGVTLNKNLIILDPNSVRELYVQPLYELRKHKGLTIDEARAQLQDNVVLGTMMVQMGEVDGLVSGAVHTTANTIRPALQIIKTKPDSSIVSSVFFMCLPDQVLVYADCAINPNPTAEELADIAIQSADSAKAFGITPRIALLSYSTGTSGAGPDVEKIKEAATIASSKRPDLPIEGPIQYDAAIAKDVAALKLPNSKVAGMATVFIFPDLNAGNIACKAVQRSTNIICIGPMLQGLRKPVNDLSRGCLVEDIVFTIAITAIQAKR
jgi:phosphate acetyltransferase